MPDDELWCDGENDYFPRSDFSQDGSVHVRTTGTVHYRQGGGTAEIWREPGPSDPLDRGWAAPDADEAP